jgi:hypothetical protein
VGKEKKLLVNPDDRQVYAFEEVRDARLESADQLLRDIEALG